MDVFSVDFFRRDTHAIALDLLGQNLCVRRDEATLRARISEVEVYEGFEDRASHAHRSRTKRNDIMFRSGGNWYIYLCYGVHWMLNVTTGQEDYPAAILIRGIEGFDGPGKLTRGLGIDKRFNERPICPETGLWVEPSVDALSELDREVHRLPRVGVAYAGEEWASKLWRYRLQ